MDALTAMEHMFAQAAMLGWDAAMTVARAHLCQLFALLVVYQLKHWLADYPLQNEYMLGKFKPGWDFVGPLSMHVAVHGGLTFFIIVAFTHMLGLALTLAAFDAVVHFVMDRIKAGPKYMGRWKPLTGPQWMECKRQVAQGFWGRENEDPRVKLRGNVLFWWALGVDQMVHHLTHYACIFFAVRALGWF